MSVLIKGMDMPKSCKECKLISIDFDWFHCCVGTYDNKHCLNLEDEFEKLKYTKSRHPKCPLVPLPEKHGRLIDVDALQQTIIEEVNSGEPGEQFATIDVIQLIESAPTIIEAEE